MHAKPFVSKFLFCGCLRSRLTVLQPRGRKVETRFTERQLQTQIPGPSDYGLRDKHFIMKRNINNTNSRHWNTYSNILQERLLKWLLKIATWDIEVI